jgi:hypothetical protein
VICYNLGNMLFDWQEGNVRPGMAALPQTEGAVFAFDLDHHGVERLGRMSSGLQSDGASLFWQQRSERNVGLEFAVLGFHLRRGHVRAALDIVRRIRPYHVRMVGRWLANRLRSARG